MKQFYCQCGQAVFFDSSSCVACGAILGFDPTNTEMLPLREAHGGFLLDPRGRTFRMCANGYDYGVCNWLVAADSQHPLCPGCQFNRTIPNLGQPENVRRWRRFEIAKKRLLFTLVKLDLPLKNGFEEPNNGLLFDFIEDQRSNPEQYPESFVHTGFKGGVITVNAMEADDAVRESIKAEMNESYRTLLGHLRHESGHYYWSLLDPDAQSQRRFGELFGDPSQDYGETLAKHYSQGPKDRWHEHFISAYASAHPLEDWAETWGHYLLIYDSLETAACCGLVEQSPRDMDMTHRITLWSKLSVILNELNRSSGLGDVYPFVVNTLVVAKLEFVDQVIRHSQTRPQATVVR